MSDDLVERVAMAIKAKAAESDCFDDWSEEARAAIRVVVEEAAKLAEVSYPFDADGAARAIRALAKEDSRD